MIMVSTYSVIMVCDDQKEEYLLLKGKVLMFKYEEPFARCYL